MWKTKRNAGKRGKGDLIRCSAIKWRTVHEFTRGRQIKHAQHAVVVVFIVSLALRSSRFTFEDVYWQKALHWRTTSLYDAHIYRLYSLHIYTLTYIMKAVYVSVLTYLDDHPLHLTRYSSLPCGNQTRVEDSARIRIHVCLCACLLPSSGVCWGYTRHQRPALPPRSAPPWLFSSHSHLILRELNVCVCAREGARGGYANARNGPRRTPSTWRHTFFKEWVFGEQHIDVKWYMIIWLCCNCIILHKHKWVRFTNISKRHLCWII